MSFLFSKKNRVPSIDVDHDVDNEMDQEPKIKSSMGRIRSKSSMDNNKQVEQQPVAATEQQSSPSSWGIFGRARANSSKQADNNTDRFHKAEQELEKEHHGNHLKEKGKLGDYEDEHDEDEQQVKNSSKRKFSLKKKNAELLTE